jgi:hypothetical protein
MFVLLYSGGGGVKFVKHLKDRRQAIKFGYLWHTELIFVFFCLLFYLPLNMASQISQTCISCHVSSVYLLLIS